jgi:hypothetical protein
MEKISDEFVVGAVNEERPKHYGPRVNSKVPEADVFTEFMKNDGNPTNVPGSLKINKAPKPHVNSVNFKMEVKQEGFDEFLVSGVERNYSGPRVNVKAPAADGRSNDKKEDGDQAPVPVFPAGNVKTEPKRLTKEVKVEVKQEVSDGSVVKVKTVSIPFCSITPTSLTLKVCTYIYNIQYICMYKLAHFIFVGETNFGG